MIRRPPRSPPSPTRRSSDLGQDAVISALGRGNSFRSEQLMSRSMDIILPAMKREGVRRLIVTSAFGVGETFYEVDRKSTRLNSSHLVISYAVFCLKKKK